MLLFHLEVLQKTPDIVLAPKPGRAKSQGNSSHFNCARTASKSSVNSICPALKHTPVKTSRSFTYSENKVLTGLAERT